VEDPEVKVIGTRHGEKLHETLLSREEMVKASDMGNYYRVPLDARSLEYELYYEDGEPREVNLDDYTSENTERMDLEQTKALLSRLPEMQAFLPAVAR
jgi:UDP-glucose 4-epimerase